MWDPGHTSPWPLMMVSDMLLLPSTTLIMTIFGLFVVRAETVRHGQQPKTLTLEPAVEMVLMLVLMFQ